MARNFRGLKFRCFSSFGEI